MEQKDAIRNSNSTDGTFIDLKKLNTYALNLFYTLVKRDFDRCRMTPTSS